MPGTADPNSELDQVSRRIGAMLDAAEPDSAALEGLDGTDPAFGRYEGLPPKIALEDDGRSGTLLAPLAYHSPGAVAWPVPEGAWLDGASIPKALWSIVGSPYTGKYRNASIVHDHFCITRDRSWQDTHRMFHDAMRCSGVGKARAVVMFQAVYRFGPRWPGPGLEGIAGQPVERLTSAALEEFERDAEAIVTHGLNADEATALADAREAAGSAPALEGVSLDRARLLVIPGGSGTPEDVAAVTADAVLLPPWVVDHFLALGIRILACRGSVTDFERDLKGVVPRGWERVGRTWDSVPGSYFDGKRRVVIATCDSGGRRIVPGKDSRLHGSDSLVVHESMHGYDYSTGHTVLSNAAFRDARQADRGGLTPYELQEGQPGLEETFAETGAQYCFAPQRLTGRCPNLSAFWDIMPVGEEGIAAPPLPEGRQPVGSVTRGADGALLFDLRATGEGGAIGHALVTVAVGEERHEQLKRELFPATGALEEMPQSPALFYG